MLRRRLLLCVAAIGLLTTPWAAAQDPIVRVEEDWELRVKVPEFSTTAPQVLTVMSPTADVAGLHATFEVNHIASVDFAAGGLHLSTWCGDTHLAVDHAGNYAQMSTESETVRWTQIMEVQNGILSFRIRNGSSNTWGVFGLTGTMRLELPTTLENLNAYNPAVSTAKSEVSFSGNRVHWLYIKRIRYIRASGLIETDLTDRYVHETGELSAGTEY